MDLFKFVKLHVLNDPCGFLRPVFMINVISISISIKKMIFMKLFQIHSQYTLIVLTML